MEKSLLEQIEICARIFSKIAIPIVLLILGICLNNTYSQKETRLKYIEIATGILNDKPTPETLPLREWAIKTLNQYAEKKLSSEARAVLKSSPLNRPHTNDDKNQVDDKKDIEKIK